MDLSNKEKEIQKRMKKPVEIPENVKDKAQAAYRRIEANEIKQEKAPHPGRKWVVRTAGSVAAVIALCFIIYGANPVMAKNLPLVGHLFERLENEVSFKGDFSGKATVLKEEPKNQESDEKDAEAEVTKTEELYSKTVNGLTITFSEAYANEQAIYLTMLAENEEAFPEAKMMEGDDHSYPAISLLYEKTYSFMPQTEEKEMTRANLEGMFLDDHTYTAILRINLANDTKDRTEYNKKYDEMVQGVLDEMGVTMDDLDDETEEGYALLEEFVDKVSAKGGSVQSYIRDVEIPESFDLHIDIKELEFVGYRDENTDINNSPYFFNGGTWSYDIPVKVDNSQTVKMDINETNDNGIGLKSVIKTPYELTVNELYKEGSDADCFIVALDANGNKLPYNVSDGSCNVFAIQDRDISTVDIYILDYMQYMEELKGEERYSNNENKPVEEQWKTLLEANAKYHKTLNFK